MTENDNDDRPTIDMTRDDEYMTDLSDLKQKLTPRGQEILESTIEERGEEWVAEHESLVLAQAKKVGMVE
jgi:hypothetical protein